MNKNVEILWPSRSPCSPTSLSVLLPSILMTHLQPMVKGLVAVTALFWAAELLLIRFGGWGDIEEKKSHTHHTENVTDTDPKSWAKEKCCEFPSQGGTHPSPWGLTFCCKYHAMTASIDPDIHFLNVFWRLPCSTMWSWFCLEPQVALNLSLHSWLCSFGFVL